MKKISLFFFIILFSTYFIGCTNTNQQEPEEPLEHNCMDYHSLWIDIDEFTCGETGRQKMICNFCEQIIEERTFTKTHYYDFEVIQEQTCTVDGIRLAQCIHCDDNFEIVDEAKGHKIGNLIVKQEPTDTFLGKSYVECPNCNGVYDELHYIDNGFIKNGKLSVVGRDLVNQYGEKFQLYGLSTHGLQWFGHFVTYDTIKAIQQEFGNNVIRFALYTDEGGYCSGNPVMKEQMLKDLEEGIEIATALGLYVIIDWHMVGAENVLDKNPLTYLEESKEFFSTISKKYKDYDNILYEIMNEPNGSTTWADCKKYANEVIPCIRQNTDAIILVGNPKWTADLNSVMKSPLTGYTNIMYTYHFYAADHSRTTQVENAYDSGFPVFISEFGFMDSSGDGNISTTNGEKWKKVLDSRNISYVAWNISNSKGSASIFKYLTTEHSDVSDENLKPWGVYLKNWYREKSKLDELFYS